MSVYSGFATRNLESTYNKSLCDLLQLLQIYLINFFKKGKFYSDSSHATHFLKPFYKILDNLKALEQQKHLKPMFSNFCEDLSEFLMPFQISMPGSNKHHEKVPLYSNQDSDFQIMSNGLAYDESRVQHFSPYRLHTVLEKPRSKNISREKTQKLLMPRNATPDLMNTKYQSIFKKNEKQEKIRESYKKKGFPKIDSNTSY